MAPALTSDLVTTLSFFLNSMNETADAITNLKNKSCVAVNTSSATFVTVNPVPQKKALNQLVLLSNLSFFPPLAFGFLIIYIVFNLN